MDERSEQTPIEPYTEPVLVEVGTFSQDTLGMGFLEPDFIVGTQG
ncbi:lasso RiPP family leader peptide-containing protein [Saccharopolyspora taberi]